MEISLGRAPNPAFDWFERRASFQAHFRQKGFDCTAGTSPLFFSRYYFSLWGLVFPSVSFGFVGSIEESKKMEGAATPLNLQIVAKLSFKFGKKAEEMQNSFAYARVNAFASRACLNESFDSLGLWTPVQGPLDVTASDYNSDQLAVWRFTNVHLAQPPFHSFPIPHHLSSLCERFFPLGTHDLYRMVSRPPLSYWGEGIELCAESISIFRC